MTEVPPIPTHTPQPQWDAPTIDARKLSKGAIVGIVLGGIALVLAFAALIIFAIIVPIFASQHRTASDVSAKVDVSTLGKDIAIYFVDHSEFPRLVAGGEVYVLTGEGTQVSTAQSPGVELGGLTGTGETDWCVWVTHPEGEYKSFQYSALGGLEQGSC